MGIRPRDGWDEPDPANQSLQPQGYSTPQPYPQQQPAQTPPQIHYVYLPQPAPIQQTVVVQTQKSSSGCLVLCLLLLFPLWPITIPVAIIYYLCRDRSDSLTVVHSSGFGQPNVANGKSSGISSALRATLVVAVVIVIFIGIASLIRTPDKPDDATPVVYQPIAKHSATPHEVRMADLRRQRRKTQAFINQISAAIAESGDTDMDGAAHTQLTIAIQERANINQALANEQLNGDGNETAQPIPAAEPPNITPQQ